MKKLNWQKTVTHVFHCLITSSTYILNKLRLPLSHIRIHFISFTNKIKNVMFFKSMTLHCKDNFYEILWLRSHCQRLMCNLCYRILRDWKYMLLYQDRLDPTLCNLFNTITHRLHFRDYTYMLYAVLFYFNFSYKKLAAG